jgi:hypothetical protein
LKNLGDAGGEDFAGVFMPAIKPQWNSIKGTIRLTADFSKPMANTFKGGSGDNEGNGKKEPTSGDSMTRLILIRSKARI